MKRTTHVRFAVALAGLAISVANLNAQSADPNVVSGTSKPSVHSKLGMRDPGVIREIPIKEGQIVKKGDVLIQQDDRQERALMEALELEANSNAKIEAAKADLKIKQDDFERKKSLLIKGSATQNETEEAEIKVIYADTTVKVQELEQQVNKLKVKQQQVKLDQMSLESPIDGVVETIDASVGEITDPQKPLMTVVQNDPLWIEFYLPTTQSLKLKVGQQLEVRYPEEQQWLPATMIYRAPVADYGSFTQKVRLELKNAQLRDTGLEVQVKLPPELGPVAPAAPAAALLPPAP